MCIQITFSLGIFPHRVMMMICHIYQDYCAYNSVYFAFEEGFVQCILHLQVMERKRKQKVLYFPSENCLIRIQLCQRRRLRYLQTQQYDPYCDNKLNGILDRCVFPSALCISLIGKFVLFRRKVEGGKEPFCQLIRVILAM